MQGIRCAQGPATKAVIADSLVGRDTFENMWNIQGNVLFCVKMIV